MCYQDKNPKAWVMWWGGGEWGTKDGASGQNIDRGLVDKYKMTGVMRTMTETGVIKGKPKKGVMRGKPKDRGHLDKNKMTGVMRTKTETGVMREKTKDMECAGVMRGKSKGRVYVGKTFRQEF